MVTSTPATATTTNGCGWCAPDNGSEEVFSFRELHRAYGECRRRKRSSRDAQRYEMVPLDKLFDTLHRLRTNAWLPATPRCFVAVRPKAREIHAAPFADRVVHHWLVPRLERLFERVFIYDLYSNRRDRGTHAAVARLQKFLRAPGSTHYLQLDIRNFFNTIHKPTLFYQLQQRLRKALRQGKIGQPEALVLRTLCHRLLRQDGSKALLVGAPEAISRLPAHRRLTSGGPERGLPIGNLTSQFFANVYLNEMDQFVKRTLGYRSAIRGCTGCFSMQAPSHRVGSQPVWLPFLASTAILSAAIRGCVYWCKKL